MWMGEGGWGSAGGGVRVGQGGRGSEGGGGRVEKVLWFLLVFTYNLLEDRRMDDVIIIYIKQIPCYRSSVQYMLV